MVQLGNGIHTLASFMTETMYPDDLLFDMFCFVALDVKVPFPRVS